MSTRRSHSRTLATGVTATTFVVVFAMVSAASASGVGVVPVEGCVRLGETKAVRAMAAAVAAVARDMMGDHQTHEVVWSTSLDAVGTPCPQLRRPPAVPPGGQPAERLGAWRLDLPPPLV